MNTKICPGEVSGLKTGLTCDIKNAIICVMKNALRGNVYAQKVAKLRDITYYKERLFMRINTYAKLETIYKRYRGYVATKVLLDEGFSNRQIAVLVEEGYFEKIAHGYYWLAGGQYEKPQDYKCVEVCLSNPKAVICMDSALYYQRAIETEPEYLSVATKRTDRSMLKMNFPTKRHYFSDSNFQIGIRRQETEFGCYQIYDIERSICDVRRLEPQTTLEIIDGVRNNERQYKRLLKYAELLRIKQLI
ncbi:hypothetical protein ABXS75_17160 [Roseburia hominis]